MTSFWKWSNGDIPEKSTRLEPEIEVKNQTPQIEAFTQSLLSENDAWKLQDAFLQNKQMNKREDTYNKMSEREILCQINQNPFLSSHNYLEDVITQNNFLKPLSTNLDREKTVNSTM